jgi:hypothetical protein
VLVGVTAALIYGMDRPPLLTFHPPDGYPVAHVSRAAILVIYLQSLHHSSSNINFR